LFLAGLKQKILSLLRDKKFWALLFILGIAAYFRLWHIDSLFNAFDDYDQGVLSLQARNIADGYLPYKEFILVHPPLYYLLLSAVYKTFGFSLLNSQLLSVFFSLVSVVIIFFIGKKLFHTGAALVAAGLFAVSPDMVYIGRRVDQEALGIFLIMLAVYFVCLYIVDNRGKALPASGLALGLALATKYLFLPAVLALIVSLIVYLMGRKYWHELKGLVDPAFLVVYVLLNAACFALILVFSRLLDIHISIPFLSTEAFSTASVVLSCGVFIGMLFLTVRIMKKPISTLEWLKGIGQVLSKKEIWYLVLGIVAGFLLVTSYYLIKSPDEFIHQTLLLQKSRLLGFPSLSAMLWGSMVTWEYLKIAFFTAVMSLPLAIVIFNKKAVSSIEFFTATAILAAFLFCQALGGVPRYYYSVYPFMMLGLASFVPYEPALISANIRSLSLDFRLKLVGLMSVAFVFAGISLMVLADNPGYDYANPRFTADEQYIYGKTIDYLESVAPARVCALNPIYIALSPKLKSSINADTFAQIGLENHTAEQFIQNNIQQGADYFVLDYYTRYMAKSNPAYIGLELVVAKYARLVQTIGFESLNHVDIYQVVPEGVIIINSDFSKWATAENTSVPAGWQQIFLVGDREGDSATITRMETNGRAYLRLTVEETGPEVNDRFDTYSKIHQSVPFPISGLLVEIMPQFDGSAVGGQADFGVILSDDRHSIKITFSPVIKTEQFEKSVDGKSVIVTREAELGEWSTINIDAQRYWKQAAWELPEKVDISFFVSTKSGNSGRYEFDIAGISSQSVK
jgi:hypothetical protein